MTATYVFIMANRNSKVCHNSGKSNTKTSFDKDMTYKTKYIDICERRNIQVPNDNILLTVLFEKLLKIRIKV